LPQATIKVATPITANLSNFSIVEGTFSKKNIFSVLVIENHEFSKKN